VITAQLQQAISLLTMTNIELSAYLESQAEENPFLDCDPAVETTAELPAAVKPQPMALSAIATMTISLKPV
jgi:DNA-directed RNA polymerase specialized sigma54-like protein